MPRIGANVAARLGMTALPASQGKSPRIVIVAPDTLTPDDDSDPQARFEAERSRSLRIGLLEGGYDIVAVLPADVFLPDRLNQIQPDMIIVDAESQARDTLEHVVMATRDARRPIVLFTNDDDTTHVPAAIAAGVTAYVVAGMASDRVKPVLEVAMARFQHEEGLRRELATARNQGHLDDQARHPRARGLCAPAQDGHGQGPEDRRRGAANHRRVGPAGLSFISEGTPHSLRAPPHRAALNECGPGSEITNDTLAHPLQS
jgi:two-component system, response regulator / RNA-binding antiterminator